MAVSARRVTTLTLAVAAEGSGGWPYALASSLARYPLAFLALCLLYRMRVMARGHVFPFF